MKILSKRIIMENKPNNKKSCFDIIFEWEDIFSEQLDVPLLIRTEKEFSFDEKARKIYQILRIPFFRLFSLFDKRGNNVFMFDASTKKQDGIYNSSKYIPCLIDYFLDDVSYYKFLKAYKKNPLVLVSSREVYEYLIEKKCPIPIEHLPLSLPDKYWKDERITKKYDLVMFARQNPLLESYVDRYEKSHLGFVLIRRKFENNHYIYYRSSDGEEVGFGDTREEYMELVSASKVALYTTPGMDGTRSDANGWNQVTPHFLEEIAGQCHIIARYPDNADTRWYQMSEICGCVKSYDEFEALMDRYLSSEVDLEVYNRYLSKHITSQRVKMMKSIMEKYNLF